MQNKAIKDHPVPALNKGLGRGFDVIRQALATAPDQSGVYRMLDIKGAVIYVGKAKNLKKRLTSYTRVSGHTRRILRMIGQTAQLDITITGSEAEALLLESTLIKRLKPPYNILLRDDKSFPYILMTSHDDWPRIRKHRGGRHQPGAYYGPFASTRAVNKTLMTLERAFLLRSCSDGEFANRTRPCLLYQIKRCSAPCVGRITPNAYQKLVSEARDFLEGRDQNIIESLTRNMQTASAREDYELALRYRDRIRALRAVYDQKTIHIPSLGHADVIALHQDTGRSCIQIFFFRGGRHYGNRGYFPRHDPLAPPEAILSAFIGQFYAARPAPQTLLLSHPVKEKTLLEDALTSRSGHRVHLTIPCRGIKKEAVKRALDNAREALTRKYLERETHAQTLIQLARCFDLKAPPRRIEVYDNSHIQGNHALGAMIVSGPEGFQPEAYRKFNARTPLAKTGDDYALLREVLNRRFSRLVKENPTPDKTEWPDLLLIDGGAGHLSVAKAVLADYGLESIPIVAIAKGPDRRAGKERFYLSDGKTLTFEARDPVLYYTQCLRDEVHHFAITGHRTRRHSAIRQSLLEEIEGIGPTRKRALILHLGSAHGVREASVETLANIPGIGRSMAQIIYDHFHEHAAPGSS